MKKMKDKLELKHLAPYLPYGLKVLHQDHIGRLVSFYLTAGSYKNDAWYLSMEDDSNHELSCNVKFNETKPILRPLSDLTKEIEHNEDSFTPIIELLQINHELVFNYRIENELKKEVFEDEVNGGCIIWDDVNRRSAFSYSHEGFNHSFMWTYEGDEMTINQYDLFQKLFKWHFDVFNLIPKGLAIDINILKND